MSDWDLERRWDCALPRECPYRLEEITAFDANRDRTPHVEWPSGVAALLEQSLGVKHYVFKAPSRGSGWCR